MSYSRNLLNQSEYPGNGDQALQWASWITVDFPSRCAFPSLWNSDCRNATSCIHDIGSVFQSSLQFLNCAVYPNISHDISEGTFPDIEVASKYNITNDSSLAAGVTLALSGCLTAYCGTLPGCKATGFSCSPEALVIGNGSMLSAAATNDCWSILCSGFAVSSINTDIIGIGVSLGLYSVHLSTSDLRIPRSSSRISSKAALPFLAIFRSRA